jgi:hypothetical protein
MFGALVARLQLSQAAVVAQNLLEVHGAGSEVAPIAGQLANKLVQKVYVERPAVFQGREVVRPHKLSLAAAALAWGSSTWVNTHKPNWRCGSLLVQYCLRSRVNPSPTTWGANDRMLLAIAEDIYLASAG